MARGLKGQMSQPYCGPNFSGESFLSRNLLNPLFHLEWYRNPAYIEQLLEGIYSLCAQFRRLINNLYIALSHLLFQLSTSELKAGVSPCLLTLLLKSKVQHSESTFTFVHRSPLPRKHEIFLFLYEAFQEKISENSSFWSIFLMEGFSYVPLNWKLQ